MIFHFSGFSACTRLPKCFYKLLTIIFEALLNPLSLDGILSGSVAYPKQAFNALNLASQLKLFNFHYLHTDER